MNESLLGGRASVRQVGRCSPMGSRLGRVVPRAAAVERDRRRSASAASRARAASALTLWSTATLGPTRSHDRSPARGHRIARQCVATRATPQKRETMLSHLKTSWASRRSGFAARAAGGHLDVRQQRREERARSARVCVLPARRDGPRHALGSSNGGHRAPPHPRVRFSETSRRKMTAEPAGGLMLTPRAGHVSGSAVDLVVSLLCAI